MTLLDRSNTLVIVPAFNEQDSIVAVIEEIKATGFPFVVIDDGSTDETRIRAISAGARTISLPFNAGVGGSLKCGFRYAIEKGYQAVIQCDADGQHPTESFECLLDEANQKSNQLVIGSRFSGGEVTMDISKHRRLIMQVLSKSISRVTTSGCRLISQPLLGEFARSFPCNYLGDTYEALTVAVGRNYSVSEISAPLANRKSGKSTASNSYATINIFRVLSTKILRIQFKIGENPHRING
jgi:glycosyltransferase involved in cell wall biosynthesis